MGQNLTGQTIASTYEDLVQISGSSRNFLTDGTGSDITNLAVTASHATSASYASTASVVAIADDNGNTEHKVLFANTTVATSGEELLIDPTAGQLTYNPSTGILSTTASFAQTASFALNVPTVNTSSLMVTGSVSSNTLTFTKGDGSTFNLTVDTGSAVSTPTGSLMVTGSVTNNTLTFTKGDGSTFNLTVDTGSGATVNTGSLLVTASISDATTTYTKGDGSTFALTTNNVQNATSASFATTASYAETANLGTFASASFTGSTWAFTHNLGRDYVIIDCYDNNNEEIIPSTIDLVTTNQASITFPVSVQGVAVASLGSSTTTNSVTNNITNNTYNSFSSINSVSSQVSSFSTGYTQKLTITSTGTYNLHVSQSGPHWVDFTGLASGTTANLNIYMWVDSFAALSANSGSMIMFNAAAGTGNYVTYRTIITGSGTYWATNTVIGNTSTSVARNATLARRDFNNSAVNPTAIVKTIDGDIMLYNPGSPLYNITYNFTGNQGTPIP